jgi:hypothetical protein
MLVGALGEEAQKKRRRDDAARQQRRRDNLALQGLTPVDLLSEEALATRQQGEDSRQWIGGAEIKKPRAAATPAAEAKVAEQRLQLAGRHGCCLVAMWSPVPWSWKLMLCALLECWGATWR